MDEKDRKRLLKRGVVEIIVESDFVELLNTGKPLRLKMGFDPSAPDIHVGHAVGLRKLRQLQDRRVVPRLGFGISGRWLRASPSKACALGGFAH